MTAAFAGIPSLAIVAALIKGPGEAGYDELLLGLGIAAAAIGALVGILAFAEVFAPVALTDKRLSDFRMVRIAGLPKDIGSFRQLLKRIGEADGALSQAERTAMTTGPAADVAKEAAAEAEKRAEVAEKRASEPDATEEAKQQARVARENADAARLAANEASLTAGLAKADVEAASARLKRFEALKTTAYRLEAGEIVRLRFVDARAFSILAVLLVALGIGLMAVAPEEEEPSAQPVLVSVTLTDKGREALNCDLASITALRVGGSDAKPSIITFPQGSCARVFANFPTTGKAPWGSVTPAEAIEPKK
jgi:hypothetical protein